MGRQVQVAGCWKSDSQLDTQTKQHRLDQRRVKMLEPVRTRWVGCDDVITIEGYAHLHALGQGFGQRRLSDAERPVEHDDHVLTGPPNAREHRRCAVQMLA